MTRDSPDKEHTPLVDVDAGVGVLDVGIYLLLLIVVAVGTKMDGGDMNLNCQLKTVHNYSWCPL